MVLNRVASNYVQLRTRRARDSSKNENVDSSAKSSPRDLKSVRTYSSTTARIRERRSRLTGGVKGRLQRAKDDKKRFDHSQRSSTQPTRTSTEAGPSANPLPHSYQGQKGTEEFPDVEMASENARDRETEPQSYAVHQLKHHLVRPAFNEVTGLQLAAVDPSLGEIPAPYVRDSVELIGSNMYDGLSQSNIIGFQGRDEKDPRLPAKVIVERPESIILEPSHALALHSGPVSPDAKRKVSIQLCYSLLLAAHCSKLPPIPTPSADDGFVSHEDARGKFMRYKLSVTPLRVPSVELFPVLVSYLCTLDEQKLLSILLGVPTPAPEPVQLPTPESSPSHLNESALQVDYLTSEVHTMSVQLAALHDGDCGTLLLKMQRVWNLYRNAVSLGVGESGLWSTMQTAWSALLLAAEILSNAGGVPAAANY